MTMVEISKRPLDEISLVMVVRNEAHRLEHTVAAVTDIVDEVNIVVQTSTDGTEEIARELADNLLLDSNVGFCEKSRPKALAMASKPWVLLLDGDERVTPHFRRDIWNIQHDDRRFVGAYLPTRLVILPQKLVLDDVSHYRFFRRNAVILSPELHGGITPIGEPLFYSDGVCLLNVKSWKEQYEDEIRYEAEILSAEYLDDVAREVNLNALFVLHTIRAGFTLEEIENMTLEELGNVGIK